MTTVAPDPRRTSTAAPTEIRPHHQVLRVPGVYPVQRDTWLLADVLRRELTDHGCGPAQACRVLELGAGAGALSVVAAGVPGTDVTAVDVSRRAIAASSFLNEAVRNTAPIRPDWVRTWRPTMTFSSAVMSAKSRMFWKVRAMPAFATSCTALG